MWVRKREAASGGSSGRTEEGRSGGRGGPEGWGEDRGEERPRGEGRRGLGDLRPWLLGIWGSGTPCGERGRLDVLEGQVPRRRERSAGSGAGRWEGRGRPEASRGWAVQPVWAPLERWHSGLPWGRQVRPGVGAGAPEGGAGRGCQGEGFRLLSPQLTSDPRLTPRTGGATRIISRETSCQVQPGRGPQSRPRHLLPGTGHPLLPGSPSPSPPPPRSPAQPLHPSGSPRDIIHAHFK